MLSARFHLTLKGGHHDFWRVPDNRVFQRHPGHVPCGKSAGQTGVVCTGENRSSSLHRATLTASQMGIQLLGPIATFIFAPFLPESPRWLVEKGHLERARNVLQYLHGHRPAFDVDHELGHLEATIKAKLALGKTSWVDIFRGSNGKRTFIATGLQALQQAQGINFMGSYLVIFFQQLGFTNA